ncbi:MAG: TRAP transporter small permease subunit [Rhodobacteraceae bacterium]|nr:TRAP transporter small permease subunit [Paracoccaceae bacterium]
MPGWTAAFVVFADRLNRAFGRFAMYLLYVLMAVLLWSSLSKLGGQPSLWTLEMAQFVMVAYYVLGGAYTMQIGGHVRMDLFYARWSPGTKALVDAFTMLALIFYIGVMLWGAIESTVYSLTYAERSPTAWRPYLWPIKLVMCLGFVLMLLQATAEFLRDIARLRGVDLPS